MHVKHASEPLKTLNVGTTEIEYFEAGEGEPLLLVHGGVFADWFLPLAESETLRGFHVIRVRRAGYGRTPPPASVSLNEHARHLALLLRSLHVGTAHVVGHSSGALIGLQLALDEPDLVQSLVLIEPAPLGPFQVPAFAEVGQRFVGPAMAAFSDGDVPTATDRFMLGVCGEHYRDVLRRSLGEDAHADVLRESPFFFKDEIPACMQWQFGTADAECVTLPVLVVEGAEGRRTGDLSRQVTERAMELFPAAEVVLIEDTNHMLPLQNPEGLGRTVAGFAGRHTVPSRLPVR
jgi:pimeloyl-ACP methyl ester carboxylesterase